MRSRGPASGAFAIGAVLLAGGALGCGAKTGLLAPDLPPEAGLDVADVPDAPDASDTPDVPDVPRDAPPPCAEGTENVFILGQSGELYAFDPAHSSARFIGNVPCARAHGGFNSMAVARDGTAYAAAFDGALVAVSTRDASCTDTPFADGSFGVFCMGFSLQGIDDVLFVSSCHAPPFRLGRIDTGTFQLRTVGSFSPQPAMGMELTGDRRGQLFGYWDSVGAISLGTIAPGTGAVSNITRLPFRDFHAFAFAQWGGDFYFFADGVAGSDVVRFHPADQSYSIVTHVPIEVVGAGVSTCAPAG